jgi:photosynthetic reaction center cytochrome c subunit
MRTRKKQAVTSTGLVLLLALVMAGAVAQSKAAGPGAATKTAAETFKNIQVLKDAPAEQLIPAMQFISASLGVGCDHCHVRGGFEKDDKEAKQTARKMMQMMFAINQTNFGGHREVTCYSCHRGGIKPLAVPAILEDETLAAAPQAITPDLSADKILDKYLQALGGIETLARISRGVEKGKAVLLPGREFPMEADYKAPDKVVSAIHFPDGDLATGYNHQGGWQITPGRPIHDLSSAELDAARLDSSFYFPAHLKELFTDLKVAASEKIGGHEAYVVTGNREPQLPVKLYFDPESGLLLRFLRYEQTPVGTIPVQTDFSDYRDAGGIKVPYQRIVSRPARRLVLRIEQVEQNAAVEDSIFDKPSAPTAPGQQTPPR